MLEMLDLDKLLKENKSKLAAAFVLPSQCGWAPSVRFGRAANEGGVTGITASAYVIGRLPLVAYRRAIDELEGIVAQGAAGGAADDEANALLLLLAKEVRAVEGMKKMDFDACNELADGAYGLLVARDRAREIDMAKRWSGFVS